jgi:hypothetical protein
MGQLKVLYKLMKKKFMIVPSFCKDCGIDVKDFIVPDEIWKQIEPTIKLGNVLCYQCFCKHCENIGLPIVWELKIQNTGC